MKKDRIMEEIISDIRFKMNMYKKFAKQCYDEVKNKEDLTDRDLVGCVTYELVSRELEQTLKRAEKKWNKVKK